MVEKTDVRIFFRGTSLQSPHTWSQFQIEEFHTEEITDEVAYNIIDVQRDVLLANFKTKEGAEGFIIDNPIYRRPEVKIIPSITKKDMNSLGYLIRCMSTIYDVHTKKFFNNEVIEKIAREFLTKIDDIESNRSVRNYVSLIK